MCILLLNSFQSTRNRKPTNSVLKANVCTETITLVNNQTYKQDQTKNANICSINLRSDTLHNKP